MSFRCLPLALCVGVLLGWVEGHPGRPPLMDPGKARDLFHLVESHDGHSDGTLSPGDLNQVFQLFDMDDDSRVSKAEFKAQWVTRELGSDQAAEYLFDRADTNHDGSLTDFPDMQRVFKYFDYNGDGGVNEFEFVVTWSKLSS
ncbi:insoluble matrix shell protein 5-like [Babylonia areolata]|uniref:insoluble matrix shell protein 5-like n=1 Tax=Babylonia areolata TaxID=304850 RepID=UPI003FD0633E